MSAQEADRCRKSNLVEALLRYYDFINEVEVKILANSLVGKGEITPFTGSETKKSKHYTK